jgi:propanol-preferring alcohol dehydrogenase
MYWNPLSTNLSMSGLFLMLCPAPSNTTTIGADPLVFTSRNLHVIGTMTGTMKNVDSALDYAKRGLLKQICKVRPLARFRRVLSS